MILFGCPPSLLAGLCRRHVPHMSSALHPAFLYNRVFRRVFSGSLPQAWLSLAIDSVGNERAGGTVHGQNIATNLKIWPPQKKDRRPVWHPFLSLSPFPFHPFFQRWGETCEKKNLCAAARDSTLKSGRGGEGRRRRRHVLRHDRATERELSRPR